MLEKHPSLFPKENKGKPLEKLEAFWKSAFIWAKILTAQLRPRDMDSNTTYCQRIVNHYKNEFP